MSDMIAVLGLHAFCQTPRFGSARFTRRTRATLQRSVEGTARRPIERRVEHWATGSGAGYFFLQRRVFRFGHGFRCKCAARLPGGARLPSSANPVRRLCKALEGARSGRWRQPVRV